MLRACRPRRRRNAPPGAVLAWLGIAAAIGPAASVPSAATAGEEATTAELSPWDRPREVLAARLDDDTEAAKEACRRAAQALAERGPEAADAVPLLARALRSRSVEVRHDAVEALGRIGPAASAAVPAILTEVDLPPDHVNYARLAEFRRLAARALGRIGPAAAPAVPVLRRALDDEDPLYRVEAALALWRIARDPAALPALEAAIGGEDGPAAFAAITALPELGDEAAGFEPRVVARLTSEDADVCRAAADWLTGRNADLLAPLAEALEEKRIVHLGPALFALERQFERLRTERWYAERDAAELAAEVDLPLRRVGPLLVGLLDAPREDLRRSAIRSLAAMGLVAVPLLLPVLGEAADPARQGAIDALQRIEGTAPPPGAGGAGLTLLKTRLVAMLRDQATHPDAAVRAAALRALARLGFGPELQSALPQLRAALRDDSRLVRRYAFEALDHVSLGSGEG